MVSCPKCGADVSEASKDWEYGVYHVNMYRCDCGNKFREYFHKGKLKFILSAHDRSLHTRRGKGTKKT